MWKKVGDLWSFTDVAFATNGGSHFITPAAEFEAIPTSLRFEWTPVENAEAYYVYIGTVAGAKDIVNSGELPRTNLNVSNLPADSTVYVRLWTKLFGTWRYTDRKFIVAGLATVLLTPADSDQHVTPTLRFQWAKLFGAEKYYLYVGTTPGAKDISDSGEVVSTSWPSAVMTGGKTYYVRMHTKIGGTWRSRDYSFGVDEVAKLVSPTDDVAASVEPAIRFQWNASVRAETYYLYVGTSPGAKDLINTGERQRTDYVGRPLPGGIQAYARLWTKLDGAWRFSDSSFITQDVPRFVTPRAGATNLGSTVDFSWTSVAGAKGYRVAIGSVPAGMDIVPATSFSATENSVRFLNLPTAGALYARVWADLDTGDTVGNVVFSTAAPAPATTVTVPQNGGTLKAGVPIQWQAAPLARAYRLKLGTSAGGADLLDTGEIQVLHRYVEGVPVGQPIYATLTTYFIASASRSRVFSFVKTTNGISIQDKIDLVRSDVATIRDSASGNYPDPNSLLEKSTLIRSRTSANCVDYANALIDAIRQSGIELQVRSRSVCLVPNFYDCHTFVEAFDSSTGRWIVLDPTFGIVARRASDGGYATTDEISVATRLQQWNDIYYEPVSAAGFAYAEDYYLDYPLLFLHVYDPAVTGVIGGEVSAIRFYTELPFPFGGQSRRIIALRCPAGSGSTQVVIDGVARDIDCSGIDDLAHVVIASSIQSSPDATVVTAPTLFEPNRYIFMPH